MDRIFKRILLISGIVACLATVGFIAFSVIGTINNNIAKEVATKTDKEDKQRYIINVNDIKLQVEEKKKVADGLKYKMECLKIDISSQLELLENLKKYSDKYSTHSSFNFAYSNMDVVALQTEEATLKDDSYLKKTMKEKNMTKAEVKEWFGRRIALIDYILCKKQLEENEKELASLEIQYNNLNNEIDTLKDSLV